LASLIGDTDHESQQPSERQHRGIAGSADWGPATVAPNSHDLVDHHLLRLAKASCLTRCK
jgi:hypothetical protein